MRIPEFSRVVLPDRSVGAAAISVARAPYEQQAENYGQVKKGVNQVTNVFSDYAIRQKQAADATAVNESAIKFKMEAADLENTMRQQRADTPDNFHKDFDGELQKLQDNYLKAAPSEMARSALRGTLDNQRAGAYENNLSWERAKSVENFAGSVDRSQATASIISAERAKSGQPIDDLLNDMNATAIAGSTIVQGSEKVEKIRLAGRKRVIDSAINSAIQYNPNYALELIEKYGAKKGGEASAIDTVMNNEGGFVAQDGSSGAPAIYGINQKWHPQEYDAAQKITQEKGAEAGKEYAKLFYKNEYWDKNKVGDLPAESQTIVMDGLVNHSSAFGKKLVEAAKDGASPAKLIEMRKAEYNRLATQNPDKYAQSLSGWLNRLDGLGQEAATEPEQMARFEKEAKASIIRLDDIKKVDRIVDESRNQKDVYEKFSNGELSLSDVGDMQEKGSINKEFADFMRQNIIKSSPVTAEEQNQIYSDIFDQVNQLEIKTKDGKIKIGKSDVTLEDLSRLQNKIIKESTRGVTGLRPLLNKLNPALLSLADIERGNNDKGFFNDFPGFTHAETYDTGYETINNFLEKQGKADNVALRAGMLSDFVEQADQLPPEIMQNKANLDVQLNLIANNIIAKSMKGSIKNIPVPAIAKLINNPSLAPRFDEMFGVGSSGRVLGK